MTKKLNGTFCKGQENNFLVYLLRLEHSTPTIEFLHGPHPQLKGAGRVG